MSDLNKPETEAREVEEGYHSVLVRDEDGTRWSNETLMASDTLYGPITPEVNQHLEVTRGVLTVIPANTAEACHDLRPGNDNAALLSAGKTYYLLSRRSVACLFTYVNKPEADKKDEPKPEKPGTEPRRVIVPEPPPTESIGPRSEPDKPEADKKDESKPPPAEPDKDKKGELEPGKSEPPSPPPPRGPSPRMPWPPPHRAPTAPHSFGTGLADSPPPADTTTPAEPHADDSTDAPEGTGTHGPEGFGGNKDEEA